MKKSNTLFTLAFFAILAFSSCEREQWGNAQKGPDDIDNRAEGQIGLSALKVSVDEQTATTVTRAGINTDNFIIRIYDMVWGIERSGFFNGREKWAKGFENQRV